jgi:hypothetical protein
VAVKVGHQVADTLAHHGVSLQRGIRQGKEINIQISTLLAGKNRRIDGKIAKKRSFY